MTRKPVALVDAEPLRLGDDVIGPEGPPQLRDESGGNAHRAESKPGSVPETDVSEPK
jgi:hypothetical protein